MSQAGGAAFSMALQLCAKVRWRGPGWAAVLPGPALTELGLGLSPQFRPRRVSPGMLSRCLATSQFAAVRGRHCLDKLMSNEQRSQDSKVWGVRGEARVVTHGNFSSYSYGNTLSNGSSTPAVLGASVPTGCPSPPAGPPALGGDPAALSPNGHCHTGAGVVPGKATLGGAVALRPSRVFFFIPFIELCTLLPIYRQIILFYIYIYIIF